MSGIDNAGERVVAEAGMKGLTLVNYRRHVAAYLFAIRRLKRGMKVLDFGCGSGHGTELLAERVARVLGVDVAPDAVRHAREHHAVPNATYRVTDGDTLAFPDAFFHAAVSVQVFEHLPDPGRHLREIARVLKPGGLYAIATPNKLTYAAANEHHVSEVDEAGLRALLSEAFHPEGVEVFGLHAPLCLAARPEVRGSEFEARVAPVRGDWLVEEGSESFSWDAVLPESFPVSAKSLATCLDLLAVCRKA